MCFLSIFVFFRLRCYYANTLGHCILRENMHVGTFMHTKAFSFLPLFSLLFSHVFFCSFGMQKLKNRLNASAKAKVASRCRFGALLVDFWPPGRALWASLGRPEALLGRFGAALGPQKVKNGLGPKLPFDSWSPNSFQDVEKDAFQDICS